VTADEIGAAAQLACLLEASAPKPGNVSPGRHFHDTRFEDFVASAVAIGPELARAGERSVGETVRAAVEATARWSRANTNLGIVLLLAPLARAAALPGPAPLRRRLATVLESTTVADAEEVYAAIRRTAPGGLGRAGAQDVAAAPTVTLRDAMALAAERDSVAREYVTDFALTFDVAVPALLQTRAAGLGWTDAAVEAFLALLEAAPDSLIARKLGAEAAARVSARAREVRALGAGRTAEGRRGLALLDAELRDARNTRNPGTSADLTAAALFVVIIECGWNPSGASRAE
jgi:triphosphoribosyl-dephospho-CoA synthase